MNSIKIIVILISLITLNACCSKKAETTETSAKVVETPVKSEKEMLEAGFQKASVIYFEQQVTPCNYLIEIESSKLLLEPQKELASEFKVAKSPVWIKFQPQRRMSRCTNAQPVGVIAIEKRN